ncbi:MAG: hypothetical protein WBX01_02275 [Nitrososphaeraceae archaeon]|jgi:hypothetical protein
MSTRKKASKDPIVIDNISSFETRLKAPVLSSVQVNPCSINAKSLVGAIPN